MTFQLGDGSFPFPLLVSTLGILGQLFQLAGVFWSEVIFEILRVDRERGWKREGWRETTGTERQDGGAGVGGGGDEDEAERGEQRWERDRGDRQTDIQTDKQTDRQTDTDRHTDRQADRQTDRDRNRQTETETQRQRERRRKRRRGRNGRVTDRNIWKCGRLEKKKEKRNPCKQVQKGQIQSCQRKYTWRTGHVPLQLPLVLLWPDLYTFKPGCN